VDLVNDVNLTGKLQRMISGLLSEGADIFNPSVGSGVNFKNIRGAVT
jgi:hypothetical protein